MLIDILTLFPQMFDSVLQGSIVGRAQERQLIRIRLHNIRTYAHDAHHTADDYPYGGGAGMVMKPEPIYEAVQTILEGATKIQVILLTPRGRLLTQSIVRELAQNEHLMLICGRYEGIDERVEEHIATDQISIGDYVLSGGEIATMALVDSVVRLIPGVMGSELSMDEESHSDSLLEYPQYTRPAVFNNWAVPPVLLSGNHAQIALWRRQQSLLRTARYRGDLLKMVNLSRDDKIYLSEMGYDI